MGYLLSLSQSLSHSCEHYEALCLRITFIIKQVAPVFGVLQSAKGHGPPQFVARDCEFRGDIVQDHFRSR